METIEKRLEFYKTMLYEHILNLFIPFYKRKGFIKNGFCRYVSWLSDNNYHLNPDFPELMLQKPKVTFNSAYWFEPKKLLPRIKCIRKAISLCKLELIEQEFQKLNN